ncbi:hypothetical protein L0U85_02915 [Glycomyces sp. L485]|uniref:hypothetical protein n=1 Tax=Glycomyces sp. L485 TaxID=2909235 RepID=UPI001F4A46E2|nr:hypothetical protein [Glycomyces sp. L485]MCH7229815.1 hypothetical protein [Glycomyces sp. L485]
MTLLRLAPAVALFTLAACGAGGDGSEDPSGGAGRETTDEEVYQGIVTVIETPEHGPQLTGAVAQSYPPLGGGLDVAGWEWDAVEHETAQGTSWGSYVLTGTFDGEAFRLAEDPVPSDEIDMADYPHLEYTEPEMPEPSEELSAAELQGVIEELAEEFPEVVSGGSVDEEHGVARVDTTLVTPELRSHAEARYPEGTYVFSELMKPVS